MFLGEALSLSFFCFFGVRDFRGKFRFRKLRRLIKRIVKKIGLVCF